MSQRTANSNVVALQSPVDLKLCVFCPSFGSGCSFPLRSGLLLLVVVVLLLLVLVLVLLLGLLVLLLVLAQVLALVLLLVLLLVPSG